MSNNLDLGKDLGAISQNLDFGANDNKDIGTNKIIHSIDYGAVRNTHHDTRNKISHSIDHNFKGAEIIHGDLLYVLPTFPDNLFGGIICDPPYASGAADQNAKQRSTAQKYSSAKSGNILPDFEGDAKDQRSWTNWMTEWLIEARRVTKPGAPICMFIDWRQLPSMTDALQWAGWIWRGVLAWDKTNSRPQRGRFRQQAELVVWAVMGICLLIARHLCFRACSVNPCHHCLSVFIKQRNPSVLCGIYAVSLSRAVLFLIHLPVQALPYWLRSLKAIPLLA